MEQENNLATELNQLQNEIAVKEHFKITRQQMRRESIRLRKETRSRMKTAMMQKKIKGGATVIRNWRDNEIQLT